MDFYLIEKFLMYALFTHVTYRKNFVI